MEGDRSLKQPASDGALSLAEFQQWLYPLIPKLGKGGAMRVKAGREGGVEAPALAIKSSFSAPVSTFSGAALKPRGGGGGS